MLGFIRDDSSKCLCVSMLFEHSRSYCSLNFGAGSTAEEVIQNYAHTDSDVKIESVSNVNPQAAPFCDKCDLRVV